MMFKSIAKFFVAICIAAILVIAACGCDDLGAYENTEEYYSSFGNITLINRSTGEIKDFSVKEYFYNEDSREDFLEGEKRVDYGDYVYMAIPFEATIDMDTLCLYLQSQSDVMVYINAYAVNESEWEAIRDYDDDDESTNGSENNENVYGTPDPDKKIGEASVHLKNGKWNSFALDFFNTNEGVQKSIQIKSSHYVLLQFKNNCVDENKQAYVDPSTGAALQKAEITMTNLLIRALNIGNGNEPQGGN